MFGRGVRERVRWSVRGRVVVVARGPKRGARSPVNWGPAPRGAGADERWEAQSNGRFRGCEVARSSSCVAGLTEQDGSAM